MFEVRIHGRGGQGVVTAAELLSVAAFEQGLHAQAFPSFGSERTGAPVVSFCRIADRPIRTREPIAHPDAVIVQDPTLLGLDELMAGVAPDACLILNSSKAVEGFWTVPATQIARERLGRPMPGAPLLGALVAATGIVSLPALEHAIRARFGGLVADGNVDAARVAHHLVLAVREEGIVA